LKKVFTEVPPCPHTYLTFRLDHGSARRLVPFISMNPLSTAQPLSTRRRFDALPTCVEHVNCVTSMQHALSRKTYTTSNVVIQT